MQKAATHADCGCKFSASLPRWVASLAESELGGIRLTDVDLPFGKSMFSAPSCPKITLDDFDQRSDEAVSFCLRNFGAFSESDWNSFSLESKGVKMIPVTSISDPETFLASMLPSAGWLYPSQLSTAGYEQDLFTCDPWYYHSEHYEILIGDSLWDFLYVWNRSITLGFNWRRRALWVPSSALSSDTMIANIAQWIRDCRFEQSSVECSVLSYSVAESELLTCTQKLQPQIHMRINHAVLEKEQACGMNGMSLSGCSKKSQRFEFGSYDTTFGVPFPEHVIYSQLGSQGWVVEVEFENPKDNLGWNFKDKVWHLPVRYRLDKKFVDRQIPSRISSQGHLVIEVNADKRTAAIEIPSVKNLCDVLLVEPIMSGSGDQTQITAGTFRRIDTSSDGQYFWSILTLFGGLDEANQFLDDKGWREVMFDMIGDKQILQDDVNAVLSDFIKKNGNTINPDTHHKNKAARQLSSALINIPSESRYIHRTRIIKLLKDARTILSDNDEFVSHQIHTLLSRNIFIQGTAARCYNCGSKRWYRIDELKTIMTCHGCSRDFALNPIESLSFHLNDLIFNGFRRFGLLPLFQSLFVLQRSARKHLIFLPQQDLFDWAQDEERQVTDLDLIGILDGEYFIGEVKSSEKGILQIDIDQLIEISMELRPAKVFIAAPVKAFTDKAKRHCLTLFERFKDTEIKVHSMPLSWTKTIFPQDVDAELNDQSYC